jgi:uncharacterized protein YpuA (DUF1002 family)
LKDYSRKFNEIDAKERKANDELAALTAMLADANLETMEEIEKVIDDI